MIQRIVAAILTTMLGLSLGMEILAQERRNIMYEKAGPTGLTYGQLAEQFFAQVVFPAELSYKGVGVKRDNVICETFETNGRGGYWVTVRARYSGKAGFVPVPVAERARVYYENGGVRIDLGGMKGALDTRSIGKWVADRLPRPGSTGNSGTSAGQSSGQERLIPFTIKNNTTSTITLEFFPTGNKYQLAAGKTSTYRSPVRGDVYPKVKAIAPNGQSWERTIRNENGTYSVVTNGGKLQIVP